LYAARNSEPWRFYAADYRTATGEQRDVMLADGTQLSLNTASAVDIRFNEGQRRIILRAGEILITSAPDPAPQYRPLIVETSQGTVQALGTRFTVRQSDGLSQVAVFEGMVEIRPNANDDASRLNAGQRATFSDMYVSATESADPAEAAWASGNLIAERMRLADFLKEVGRYRPGAIRCDPAVADLVVSGVYPIHDTDRILESLSHALPVRVSYATRYWVTVRAGS
jgi:transmembrane sensor